MAVSSVVITVEGVLQKNVSYAPIPVGIALYHGLSNTFNLLLVSDSTQKELDYWLSLEGLNKHAAVLYNEGVWQYNSDSERRRQQVNSYRTQRYSVDLVIEPDPVKCSLLLTDGFNVMNFLHAQYAIPTWRPDYKEQPKGWQNIIDYEEEMARLRALDSRLKEKPEEQF
jgi:hypothetical protein